MIKKYVFKESGLTLLELLAAFAISMLVIGVTFGALTSSIKYNKKTQSHIDLRQEANIIITQLRQQHQGENYSICYDQVLSNDKISFDKLYIKDTLLSQGECESIDSSNDLLVQFTLADEENNTFDIDTIIESKNGGFSLPIEIEKPKTDFYTYLKNNNVFVYGSQFNFQGDKAIGPDATMVVKGDLIGSQLNGGAFNNVSNIYFDGDVNIDGGSAGLGSSKQPGTIYVNGDLTLWNGSRDIYGDVYVNGNFTLKDANIHGNIYVNGDVELGNTPTIKDDVRIYYSGTLSHPKHGYPQSILAKTVHQSEVPITMKSFVNIPQVKPNQWFIDNGFTKKIMPENMKLYDDDINIKSYYDNTLGKNVDTFNNAIIVSNGDITIKSRDLKMTGVLIAPNGKVTFEGKSFEGLVVARDGFYVTSGGTIITATNITQFISDEKDFPLQ